MKISVIQSQEILLYKKRDGTGIDYEKSIYERQKAIADGFDMVEEAARKGSNLIVTIECFNSPIVEEDSQERYADYFEHLDGPLVKRFSDIASEFKSYIVAGLNTIQSGKPYNSGILFGPDGKIENIYNKIHLTSLEEKLVTAGNKYIVHETEFGNIAILICWDMQYPEAAREVALRGADLIACPTLGWENIYGRCRAYENSVNIAAAMSVNHGGRVEDVCDPSCIVNNMGEIIATASRYAPQIVTAELDIRKEAPAQYGESERTGIDSMRHIRLIQRRPDTYTTISDPNPPLLKRYGK